MHARHMFTDSHLLLFCINVIICVIAVTLTLLESLLIKEILRSLPRNPMMYLCELQTIDRVDDQCCQRTLSIYVSLY